MNPAISVAASAARPTASPVLPWLVGFGGLGLFGIAVIDASVIPIPMPSTTDLLLLLLTSHRGNPWWLAACAIVGSIIGGYLTWSAGRRGGTAALERHVPKLLLGRINRWVESHGILTLGIAAAMPPPVPLIPFLLAAGALGVSRRKFFMAFSVGRTIRYGLIAALGATYGRRAVRWSQYLAKWSNAILWVSVGLLAIAVAYGVMKYLRERKLESEAEIVESAV